jgi:hypothetical protein
VSVNSTCFSWDNSSMLYSMNESLPSFISYSSGTSDYLQNFTIDLDAAKTDLGSMFTKNFSNSIKASFNGTDYFTPFLLTLFLCQDPNCDVCSFDVANEAVGSKLCTLCKAN